MSWGRWGEGLCAGAGVGPGQGELSLAREHPSHRPTHLPESTFPVTEQLLDACLKVMGLFPCSGLTGHRDETSS